MDKKILCERLQKVRYKNIPINITNFNGEMRPYQKAGILFTYLKKVSLLADEQGLGKFIQFLGLSLYMKQKNKNYKTLFVTFAGLKHQAKNEIQKFSGETFNVKVMPSRLLKKKRKELWKEDADIFIINYELLYRDIDYLSENWAEINFQFVCFDECSILRNQNKTYWKVKKLIKLIRQNKNHKILFMTGSPVGKDLFDLYNMFALPGLSYKLFGGEYQFKKDYCVIQHRFIGQIRIAEIVGYKNVSQFADKIGINIIRRRKRDVIKDLPDVVSHLCMPELKDAQRSVYKRVAEDEELSSLQRVSFLRTICDIPAVLNERVFKNYNLNSDDTKFCKSGKIEMLEQIISNLEAADKVVVFSSSKKVVHFLHEYFSKKYTCIKITGDDDEEVKEQKKKKFNEYTTVKILFGTDCIAFGANLQSANTLIQFRVSWSSIVDEQRIKRIDRIGQKSKILNVYNFICKDTIEETVMNVLNKNKKLAMKILKDRDIINYIDFKSLI